MIKLLATVVGLSLLTGCATSLTALFHRPVVEDSIQGTVSTISLAADRRTVVVRTDGAARGTFCAEPPPDTATGLKMELEASIDAKAKAQEIKAEMEAQVDLKDKTETTVVVLAERTAALDMFRTGVYALCQYHLNGAITHEDVGNKFVRLIEAYERVSGAIAKQSK